MYYDRREGLLIGGMFWDGRATGWSLGSPLAEQAQGPFLNPVEMHNATEAAVILDISTSWYADLFEQVFPNTDWTTEAGIDRAYDDMAFAIAAYESSKPSTASTRASTRTWRVTWTPSRSRSSGASSCSRARRCATSAT